ncbi:CapA family protein [Mesorhizobium sp. STM 4661]|uniref:CapA family protein n=1 Tax=Mesorhizobium sp. STM 4661 TaxID=1297570 RepID=UPI0002BE7D98|nr:CapA family protein [Mesorhizobium sp. STM 4661]CCV10457.1 conserved hypothetical protein [Mesorhizobium sp. STM 4661]
MSDDNNSRPVHRADGYDTVGSIETNVADGFTMVAVGDLIVSRALTNYQHPGFGDVVEILHDADATFGNMETLIFDIQSFNGSPQAEYGGAYHISLPELGPDLKAMGFNMVSRANNHTLDWGLEGMRETSRVLDEAGIVHAGVGENLAQAGAARFLETKRGRVALVSFATTFTPMSRAGDPAGEAPGRPGLNPLRLTESIVVPEQSLESLKQLRDALPGTDRKLNRSNPNQVSFPGLNFRAGDQAGYSYEPNSQDVANILRNVRRGKQFSDFCIVTNHGHEPNWSQGVSQEPPDYEPSFARKMIDAGADAYIGHGPHLLRGVEIYKDRPIFYSLGNFFYDDLRTPIGADQFAAIGKDPRTDTDADVTASEEANGDAIWEGFQDPVYYESIIAVSRFENNTLAELRLYPVELGYSMRFANRGLPRLVSGPQAKAILERLQKLSEPFGTQVAMENDVGVIRLKSGSSL